MKTPSRRALTPEAALLLEAGRRGDRNAAPHRCGLFRGQINGELLLTLARDHGMEPLLHAFLEQECPERVPGSVRARLRERFDQNIACNLLLTSELLHLIRLFEKEGIAVIPFKGPALAGAVYSDLSLRPSGDLDFLLRRADLPLARALLQRSGYRAADSRYAPHGPAEKRHDHHDILERAQDGLVVELHWSLTPGDFACRLDLEGLWARREPAFVAGTELLTLSPEDLLLVLCIHGSKHGWPRLNWICDIAELIRSHPSLDWDQVCAEAGRSGGERMLRLGLRLASDLLGAPLPAALAARIQDDREVRALAARAWESLFSGERRGSAVVDRFFLRLGVLPRLSDRLRYVFHFLQRRLTPNEADRASLLLPGPLSRLYCFTRPIRLARQYGGELYRRFSRP